MALTFHVACTATVKTDAGGSLAELGITVDGVNISARTFHEPIHTDNHGGSAGPPEDIIDHGQVHTVTMDLVKYDSTQAGIIESFQKNGTVGSVAAPCVLLKADGKTFRLLIVGTNFARNYLVAFPVGEINVGPVGAKNTRMRVTFECHPNSSGVLYNAIVV